MKVLHCCLAAFYIDDYGYQENILPKMHKIQGHQVKIVSSTETYIDNQTLGHVKPKHYLTQDGIPISRIPYNKWIKPSFLARKIRLYEGLNKILHDFNPDIIFIHDLQFLSAFDIISYKKKNPEITIYADGHTDLINSGRNWISKNILHGILYKWIAKKMEPHIKKFYGTLPLRNKFMIDFYGISREKVALLPFGVDDSHIDISEKDKISKVIRKNIGFSENDFVIISGGKIDRRKNTINLMKAVIELKNPKVKLLVFGSINQDIEDEFLKLSKHSNIVYISWLDYKEIFRYFFAADLAVFPGTHSVMWEQAVGLGIPCIFKRWEYIDHIDLEGNCEFIENGSKEVISKKIDTIVNNAIYFSSMKKSAEKGLKKFLYSNIARRSIES